MGGAAGEAAVAAEAGAAAVDVPAAGDPSEAEAEARAQPPEPRGGGAAEPAEPDPDDAPRPRPRRELDVAREVVAPQEQLPPLHLPLPPRHVLHVRPRRRRRRRLRRHPHAGHGAQPQVLGLLCSLLLSQGARASERASELTLWLRRGMEN